MPAPKLILLEESLNEQTALLADGAEAISLFSSDNANADVLEKLSNIGIKYIALRSTGYDNVDLKKCKELGIKVANVPHYSPNSVAEHSFALLLNLVRKIIHGQELIKKQDFRLDELVGFNLKDKTFGIIGTGDIGSASARIAKGFGCNIIAYDVIENEKLKREIPLQYVSLEELCQKSDIITLHCLLNEKTKHLLNKEKFTIMKKGVVIINTSRGAVIDTEALIEALENKIVSAAGLDVYEYEKGLFFRDHSKDIINDQMFLKLRSYNNVIITAHQAFLTHEALTNIISTTINNLDSWEKTNSSANDLNSFNYSLRYQTFCSN